MLTNGHYKTAHGSEMWISGKHGGISRVTFDWFEEPDACVDCQVAAYEQNGCMHWTCDVCGGGFAELQLVPPNIYGKDSHTVRSPRVEGDDIKEEMKMNELTANALLGATVEWTQDRRPMPGDVPGDDGGPDSPAWDMSLVTTQRGVVLAVHRTFFGTWVVLVLVDHTGRMMEMNVAALKVVLPK